MIRSNIIENHGTWEIKEMKEIEGEFVFEKWYVLSYENNGMKISLPFDEVRASGGLLHLNRNDERSGTFNHVLDGMNRRQERAEMPTSIYQKLQDIGPW